MEATNQIIKNIYQDLKQQLLDNQGDTFCKQYIIPSVNYNSKAENIEDLYFLSGIEMELEKMMTNFDNKVFWSRYKDQYFFSNNQQIVDKKMLEAIEVESIETSEKIEESEFE